MLYLTIFNLPGFAKPAMIKKKNGTVNIQIKAIFIFVSTYGNTKKKLRIKVVSNKKINITEGRLGFLVFR